MRLKYNDESHGYWIDGRRCKSVTTIAKIPEDTYYLDKWQKRMVAIGLASDPALIEEVAAHVADKERLDRICEKAQNAAKAHRAADAGTTAHRFTEAHDAGHAFIETELAATILATWNRVLDVGGYEVVDGMVERIVCFPDLLICGTFDRLFRRKRDGRLFIADLKTGEKAIEYPHSIAVQMGIYPNAPLIAGPLNWQSVTTTFEPFPDVDKNIGIVIHMPTPDKAELVEFDIAAGWECFQQVILPTLRWRKRDNLCRRTAELLVTEEIAAGEEASTREDEGPSVTRTAASSPAAPEYRQWITNRLKALPDPARFDMAAQWPDEVPSLKASDTHTEEQLQAVEVVLNQVESKHRVPWGEGDPRNAQKPPEREAPAGRTPVRNAVSEPSIDEGGPADPAAVKVLHEAYIALDPTAREWIDQIARRNSDRPLHMSSPTVRRFELVRGLVALAANGWGDNQVVQALINNIAGTIGNPYLCGLYLSNYDAAQAAQFAHLCDDLVAGQLTTAVHETHGTLTLTTP